jgi:hypothetical protein
VSRTGVLFILGLAGSLPASAAVAKPVVPVDETVLIDQQGIAAAGGFPFKINAPGSYKLIGNLVVPENTSGILIQSNDVTLDLNGFSITGGIVCDQDGIDCTPTPTNGDTTGIEAIIGRNAQGQIANIFGVAIRNGHIRGFTFGISTFSGIVEQIHAFGNLRAGISGSSATVRKNEATRNHGNGIQCNSCLVSENIASLNQGNQFLVGFGGLLSSNVAVTRGDPGINNFGALSANNNSCNGVSC